MPFRKLSRIHPDYYLRASWHDYTSRCYYMITFNKSEEAPIFSEITGSIVNNNVSVFNNLNAIGELIRRAILDLPVSFPHVEICNYCIMPDHVHLVMFVREKTDIHLGRIVRKLKSDSTGAYKKQYPDSQIALNNLSLFHKGFNDKIVMKTGQLATFKRYVKDNPRRFLLKSRYNEFFTRSGRIKIAGKEFSIFGNFLLLRHPVRECVRVSSKFSQEEMQSRQRSWEEAIRGCGVLVSPFISKEEKKIRDNGIERGASIIRIVENGFPERYKPEGKEFELCSEGRLLLIAPAEYNTRKESLRREVCLEMNSLAEFIATEEGAMSLLSKLA